MTDCMLCTEPRQSPFSSLIPSMDSRSDFGIREPLCRWLRIRLAPTKNPFFYQRLPYEAQSYCFRANLRFVVTKTLMI